jgi:hypothetical protein
MEPEVQKVAKDDESTPSELLRTSFAWLSLGPSFFSPSFILYEKVRREKLYMMLSRAWKVHLVTSLILLRTKISLQASSLTQGCGLKAVQSF